MRIGEMQNVTGIYGKNKNVKRSDGTSGVAGKKDSVSFSGPAKDYQTVMKTLKDVPNIRQDKVSPLIDKYEAGNYNVDGKDTAGKIINSIVNSLA